MLPIEQHRHRKARLAALGRDNAIVTYCDICGSEEVEVCVSAFIDPNNWFLMDDGNVMESIHATYCRHCEQEGRDGETVPVRQFNRETGDRSARWTKEKGWHTDAPVLWPCELPTTRRLTEGPV